MQSNPASSTELVSVDVSIPSATASAFGARYAVDTMSRQSKAYIINDDAIDALSEISSTNTLLWAIMVGGISQAISAGFEVGFSAEGNSGFGWFWMVACIAASVASGVSLYFRRNRRSNVIDRMKRESFAPGQAPAHLPHQ